MLAACMPVVDGLHAGETTVASVIFKSQGSHRGRRRARVDTRATSAPKPRVEKPTMVHTLYTLRAITEII